MIHFISDSNLMFDKKFENWAKKEKNLHPDQQLAHMQKLFRMCLSNEVGMYYYSFCANDIREEMCHWHCIRCQKCVGWREWHCGFCDKCQ